jgi:hypothetical protein
MCLNFPAVVLMAITPVVVAISSGTLHAGDRKWTMCLRFEIQLLVFSREDSTIAYN